MNLEDFSDLKKYIYNFFEHQMYSFCLSSGLMNSLPINDTKDFSVAWDSKVILITMNKIHDPKYLISVEDL